MNRLAYLTEPAHVSEEQMYCLLDEPSGVSEPARLHLHSCFVCQTELATMQASFANLRAGATGYAAVHTPALARRAAVTAPRSSWMPRAIWAASFVSVMAVLGVSLSLMHPRHVTHVAQTPSVVTGPAAFEESDEALLDGIQRDLSTSVPPSLAPLEVSATAGAGNLHN